MAKIVVEFDTLNKTAVATIDGTPVDNFKSANVYQNYKDDFSIEIMSGEKDKDNEIHYMTRVCASNGILVEKDEDKDQDELDEKMKAEILSYYGIDDE